MSLWKDANLHFLVAIALQSFTVGALNIPAGV